MIDSEEHIWFARREEWSKQADDARNKSDVDYARIIHSACFRRLQGKTQILNPGENDFYRTRLTHSLEVAQIAGGLVKQFGQDYRDNPVILDLLPPLSLAQASGLAHDLGHPPFGHGGEIALNYCMRDAGGFEGNGQTLRLLGRLESFSNAAGANLTRRLLLAILKYPVSFSQVFNPEQTPALLSGSTAIALIDCPRATPPKCYLDSEQDIVDWILDPFSNQDRDQFTEIRKFEGKHSKSIHKSFDCSLMDLADDISFGVHDLEDALAMDLLDQDSFRHGITEAIAAPFLDFLKEKYPQEADNNVYENFVTHLFGTNHQRKRFISRLVNFLITHCDINHLQEFDHPLLAYRVCLPAQAAAFLKALIHLIRDEVIYNPRVQHLEFKGQKMVVSVFEVIQSDPKRFLPKEIYQQIQDSDQITRHICDYLASMTDNVLLKTYDRLFSPRMGSIFDKL